jgi:DNA-binding transcriptional regulator YiaG
MIEPEEIIKLRNFLGWTQQKLADEICTTVQTVNRWENGHTQPLAIFKDKLKALQKKQQSRGD